MPTVEKTSGGTVRIRDIGEFAPGDRADVSTADAQYLCDERGDFERIEADGRPDRPISDLVDDGTCPWCEDYEGDAVGQHASAAHPEEWAAYKDQED